MQALAEQFFNLAIMQQALPLILTGLGQTLVICLIVVPLGLAGGLAVALVSLSRSRAVRWAAVAAIDLFRSIPPLVLLIFVYSALPFAGVRMSPLTAVAVAFLLNTSSYYGEIYRAGIESVGAGQWDAARSTGLRAWQALAYVVLPQAVRNVAPPLLNDFVSLQKDTALVATIGPLEALRQAQIASSYDFNYTPYLGAALLFIAATIPLARYTDRLQARATAKQWAGTR